MPSSVKEILSEKRVNEVVKEIKTVIAYLKNQAYLDPSKNFEPLKSGITNKKMVFIDKAAEMLLAEKLKQIFCPEYDVSVYGEESLGLKHIVKSGDLGRFSQVIEEKEKITILLDAIDGTDLYLKNLGNWCTAVLIYTEKEKKILGSFVGLPSGTVYFSTDDIKGVAKINAEWKMSAVSAASSKLDFKTITLSWYGQKAKNFLSLARHKKFMAFLETQQKDSNFRMLNISGIPLMIRLIDNLVPINLIVELYGQQPHDMIAGAYLAKKTDTVLTDLDGKPLDFSHYLTDLRGDRIKYILATSKQLHKEALQIFKSSKSTTLNSPKTQRKK